MRNGNISQELFGIRGDNGFYPRGTIGAAIEAGARKALLQRNGELRKSPKRLEGGEARYAGDNQPAYNCWLIREGITPLELAGCDFDDIESEAQLKLAKRLATWELVSFVAKKAKGKRKPAQVPVRSQARTCHDLTDKQLTGLAYSCGFFACKAFLRERATKNQTSAKPESKREAQARSSTDIIKSGSNAYHKPNNQKLPRTCAGAREVRLSSQAWEALQDNMACLQAYESESLEARELSDLRNVVESLPKRGNLRRVALALSCADFGEKTLSHILGVSASSLQRTKRTLLQKLGSPIACSIRSAERELLQESKREYKPAFDKAHCLSAHAEAHCVQVRTESGTVDYMFPASEQEREAWHKRLRTYAKREQTVDKLEAWKAPASDPRQAWKLVSRFKRASAGFCSAPKFPSVSKSAGIVWSVDKPAPKAPAQAPAYSPAEARAFEDMCEAFQLSINTRARFEAGEIKSAG